MPTTWGDRLVRGMPYVLLAVSVAWTASRCAVPLHEYDAWWHLRLGEHFLDTRSFSTPDDWSTYATSTWVPTQPLSEVVAALVQRWLGLPGVVWMFTASVVLLVLAVFLLARRVADPLPAVVATVCFLAAGQNAFTARPQMLSYLFLVLVLLAWLRTQDDLAPRWWLVPLSWLWSMSHGFWFIGVAYGYLFVVALLITRRGTRRATPAQLARLAAVPVASTLVVLLNPVGPRLFVAPFVVSERGEYILEWQRTDLLAGPGLLTLLMLLTTAAIWALKRRGVTAFEVLLLLSALFWTWYAVRTVTLGAIVAAPLLAGALQSVIPTRQGANASAARRERVGVAFGAAAVLAVTAVVVAGTAQRPGDVPEAFDPLLDEAAPGSTVFNEYVVGGWLAWRHPDLNRYVDGLADAYPADHLRNYRAAVTLEPGWQEVVDDAAPSMALLLEGSRLAVALVTEEGWTETATDDGWVLLTPPA